LDQAIEAIEEMPARRAGESAKVIEDESPVVCRSLSGPVSKYMRRRQAPDDLCPEGVQA
jgi:hypothetical protein